MNSSVSRQKDDYKKAYQEIREKRTIAHPHTNKKKRRMKKREKYFETNKKVKYSLAVKKKSSL